MASCCYGKRVNSGPAGVAGYIAYGEGDNTAANTASGWGATGANFTKMVGAGVTIWAITKVLDRVFLRGKR